MKALTLTSKTITQAIKSLRKAFPVGKSPALVMSFEMFFEARHPELCRDARELNYNIWDKRTRAWRLIKSAYEKECKLIKK